MDGLPGIAVQPPNSNQAFHPFSSNDIMHDCIPVTSIVGIKEIQQQPPVVTVSPNPVSDLLNITITAGTADRVQLIISDITGKKVYQDNISTAGTGIFSFSHSVKNLSKGMYLLSINAEGAVSTSKFVVQ